MEPFVQVSRNELISSRHRDRTVRGIHLDPASHRCQSYRKPPGGEDQHHFLSERQTAHLPYVELGLGRRDDHFAGAGAERIQDEDSAQAAPGSRNRRSLPGFSITPQKQTAFFICSLSEKPPHQSSLLGGACRHGLPAGTRLGQVQEENKKDLASGAHSPDEGCALGTRPAQSHALAALGPRS